MVRVENLTKDFKSTRAVDDISFNVRAGEIVGLLGGNGAGKTTTLGMILGLVTPTGGRITILGENWTGKQQHIRAALNFSSTYFDLPGALSVRQNLTIFSGLYNVSNAQQHIAELAENLELHPLLDRPYRTLSAGQKTRVQLAKCFINRPKLLLLDEPTASLDPDTADWVRDFILQFHKEHGGAILMASHNMLEVEKMCDNVVFMKQGRIEDTGTPAELRIRHGQDSMEDVFIHIARQGAMS